MSECYDCSTNQCDCAEKMSRELDALRAERDELVVALDKNWVTHQQIVANRMAAEQAEAERDALRLENQKLCADVLSLEAERDRYRAALERIADTCYCDEPVCKSMQTHARRALNGGDDE